MSAEAPADLTAVYGFSIPSRGVYISDPYGSARKVTLSMLEEIQRIPLKYRMPELTVAYTDYPKNGKTVMAYAYDDGWQLEAIEKSLYGETAFYLHVDRKGVMTTVLMLPYDTGGNGEAYLRYAGTRLTNTDSGICLDMFEMELLFSPTVRWTRKLIQAV